MIPIPLATDQVARIAHETNRAYCEVLGDHSQPSWEQAPEWQQQSARNGVLFHVERHQHGIVPAPSASHDNWLAEKYADGWKYGPVKDPATKEHPCCVPYDELPVEQRLKDYLFGAVVEAVYKCSVATPAAQ